MGTNATATGAPGEVIKHDEQGVLVACGEGSLRIVELQFAGRNRVEAAQVRNARDLTGQRLGDSND